MNIQNPAEYKKILIVLSVLAILMIGLVAIRQINQTRLEEASRAIPTKASFDVNFPGVMEIIVDKKSIKVGETVAANVIFSAPNKRLAGGDVVVSFDPLLVEVDEDSFGQGDYFSVLPRKTIDNQKGILKVTGIRPDDNKAVTVSKTFFSVVLRAKKAGKAELRIDFEKEKSNLSSLVEFGTSKNILGSVEGVSFTIEK